jgi:type IV secretory pathway VirB2 component (pilin)
MCAALQRLTTPQQEFFIMTRTTLTPAIQEPAPARVNRTRARWAAGLTALALGPLATSAHAAVTFTKFEEFLTAIEAFMTGPFGKAVVVISIIAAFATWVFAPREGIFGPVLRVVVAGIAIMNSVVFMNALV